ncbi:MAG: hypothetical protein E7322_07875 [Clostridiales bacterium]|nr:hypothetical protein [Clostridiales bacterium]
MKKLPKEKIPARAKICTVIGGVICISAFIFVVYVESSACAIPGISNPIWARPFVRFCYSPVGL